MPVDAPECPDAQPNGHSNRLKARLLACATDEEYDALAKEMGA
jgi:hypothetical protein